MTDLIDRKEAVEAVKNEMLSWLEGDSHDYRKVVDAIMDLPTVDAVPVTFEKFRSVCKYFAVGFDEDRRRELTCRRKDMIPEGCSWGICDKGHCPYMREEE